MLLFRKHIQAFQQLLREACALDDGQLPLCANVA
jgi:hypothetical protein